MSFYVHAESKLYVDQLEEKVCISAPSHHAHIDNADAPTVALEPLKAAGCPALAELIEDAAREATEKAEAEAAEKKLTERRDALAASYGWFNWANLTDPARKSIDAYLALEDKLASRD